MNRMNRFPVIALALAAGLPTFAQSATGNLSGKVVDTNGKPLAGARLVMESPALFQPRTVVTDAKGTYRASLLPVGNYTIRVSKDGHVGKTWTDYRVGVGTELALDIQLKPIASQEVVVEVTASTASAEAAKTDRIQYNIPAETLTALPVSRNFAGAALLVPGVSADQNTGGVDIRGAGASQTQYRVDGMDVRKDSADSNDQFGPMINVIPDSIEDASIVTSTGNARFGRVMGGAAILTTKKGSNTFSGSARAWYTRKSWPASSGFGRARWYDNNFLQSDQSKQYDFTLNGPIVKDRLFFALAIRVAPVLSGTSTLSKLTAFTDAYWSGDGNTWPAGVVDQLKTRYAPGYYVTPMDHTMPYTTQNKRGKTEGTLTYALTENQTLTATYMGERRELTMTGGTATSFYDASFPIINKEFIGPTKTDRVLWSLAWRSLLPGDWYVEAQYSDTKYEKRVFQGPQQNPVSVGVFMGNGGDNMSSATLLRAQSPIRPESEHNKTLSVNFKAYVEWLGSHDIDLGVEHYEANYQPGSYFGPHSVAAGGFVLQDQDLTGPNGVPDRIGDGTGDLLDASRYRFPVVRFDYDAINAWGRYALGAVMTNYYGSAGTAKAPTTSFWANDTWTLNSHWMVMGGLRYVKDALKDMEGSTVVDYTHVEPRVQVKWDIRGTGVDTLALSAYRQGSAFSPYALRSFLKNPADTTTKNGWLGVGGPQPEAGALNDGMSGGFPRAGVRWVTYEELINPLNYDPNPYEFEDPSQLSKLVDYKPQMMNEYGITYKRQFKDGSVTIGYSERYYMNEHIEYNDYGWEHWGIVRDPSRPKDETAPAKLQQITWTTVASKARKYSSLEVSWQDTLSSRLSWGGWYSYALQPFYNPAGALRYRYLKSLPVNSLDYLGSIQGLSYEPGGNSTNDHDARVYFTYTQPIGKKGRITASLMHRMGTQRVSSYEASANLMVPPSLRLQEVDAVHNPNNYPLVDNAAGSVPVGGYDAGTGTIASEPFGHFKRTFDTRITSLKIDWSIPLVGKLSIIGGLNINNIWNESLQGGFTPFEAGGPAAYISRHGYNNGRKFIKWDNPTNYGIPAGSRLYGTDGALGGTTTPRGLTVLDATSAAEAGFSIGLKF